MRGVEGHFHTFVNLALFRGDWLTSRPGQFTLEEKPQSSVSIGREGGPAHIGVGALEKREVSLLRLAYNKMTKIEVTLKLAV
jgi:hypothetical protein